MDRAGRIVVPKPVRDRLGLKAGIDLELHETAGTLVLRPVARRASLVPEGRFLVHTGQAPPGFDIVKATEEDREERMRKLAGV